MKTSLDHLPDYKQEQLRAITALLCESVPLEMVILFGSYARGDWVEDPLHGYFSDYDLLVVVPDKKLAEDESLWSRLTEEARRITGRVPVTLMPHDFREVNAEIRTGQYFFADSAP
jgi:predicted nucleotidyltransferase